MTLRTLHTRFLFGFGPSALNLAKNHNSSDRSTKSTPSHINVLRLLVNTGFQVLFHSPLGVLFTIPSQYCSLSLTMEYLGLEGGPPGFLRDFSCPTVLWCCSLGLLVFAYVTVTLSGFGFPSAYSANLTVTYCSPQPHETEVSWFGLFRVRSPLLAESRLISLPEGTEMFQFPSYSLCILCIDIQITEHFPQSGCPIRISTFHQLFAPTRGLSQLVASFIGSW